MYTRNCPNCDKELCYSTKGNLTVAIKKGTACRSCTFKGDNHPFYGKKHSVETLYKMSITLGGSGELPKFSKIKLGSWAKRVKERDDYICQHCHLDGLPEEMDAHHIVPKAKFPQYAYDLDNGQTLCRECHRIEHNKKPNYPWGN